MHRRATAGPNFNADKYDRLGRPKVALERSTAAAAAAALEADEEEGGTQLERRGAKQEAKEAQERGAELEWCRGRSEGGRRLLLAATPRASLGVVPAPWRLHTLRSSHGAAREAGAAHSPRHLARDAPTLRRLAECLQKGETLQALQPQLQAAAARFRLCPPP